MGVIAANKKLVFAPTVLGRLNFARSSLRFTAPQQKRYAWNAMSRYLLLLILMISSPAFSEEGCELSHRYNSESKSLGLSTDNWECFIDQGYLKSYLEVAVKSEGITELRHFLFRASAILSTCLRDTMPEYGDYEIDKSNRGFYPYVSELILKECVIDTFPLVGGMPPKSIVFEKMTFKDKISNKEYRWGNSYSGLPSTAYFSNAIMWVSYDE